MIPERVVVRDQILFGADMQLRVNGDLWVSPETWEAFHGDETAIIRSYRRYVGQGELPH